LVSRLTKSKPKSSGDHDQRWVPDGPPERQDHLWVRRRRPVDRVDNKVVRDQSSALRIAALATVSFHSKIDELIDQLGVADA
jgi:hypothetical protein